MKRKVEKKVALNKKSRSHDHLHKKKVKANVYFYVGLLTNPIPIPFFPADISKSKKPPK